MGSDIFVKTNALQLVAHIKPLLDRGCMFVYCYLSSHKFKIIITLYV